MTDERPAPVPTDDEIRRNQRECEDEIKLCHQTINENQADYDKQLLTLASALLAVVLAFVKDIVPLRAAIWVGLFYATLILFTLCILCVLSSYQISIWGHYKAKKFWEDKKPNEDNSEYPFRFANSIKWINVLSGVLFALAIFFLSIFIIANLVKDRTVTNDQNPLRSTIEKGAHMRTPPPENNPGGDSSGRHLNVPAEPTAAPQSQQNKDGGTGGDRSGNQS